MAEDGVVDGRFSWYLMLWLGGCIFDVTVYLREQCSGDKLVIPDEISFIVILIIATLQT